MASRKARDVSGEDTSGDDRTSGLLELARAGDKAALSALVERDRAWVEGRVRRNISNLKSVIHTSDVIQEVMVKLLRSNRPPRAVNRAQLRAYLATVIHRLLATKAGRSLRALLRRPAVLTIVEHIEDVAPGAHQTAEDKEHLELVERALSLLSGRDQDLIRLRRKGLSFAEIGVELGISEDNARIGHGRALLRLAEKVKQISRPDFQWPSDDSPDPDSDPPAEQTSAE